MYIDSSTLVLGDFNAHNTIWGSKSTDSKGRVIEQFYQQFNLTILNNGKPTTTLLTPLLHMLPFLT